MWAQGKLSGPDGKIHLSACVDVGELSPEVFNLGTREGLVNPLEAEIQMVIHSHGPARFSDPEMPGAQLTRFTGACENIGGVPPAACKDVQQIVFRSPSQ